MYARLFVDRMLFIIEKQKKIIKSNRKKAG
jgi:hypothetical protein